MTKILGYENREIASLYLLSTTIVLVVIDVVSVILGVAIMKVVGGSCSFPTVDGMLPHKHIGLCENVPVYTDRISVVMVLDFRRIKRIPMDQALKNVE